MRHFDNRTLTMLMPMFIVQWKKEKKLEPVSYKSLSKLNLRGDFHKIVLSSQKSNFPVYYASQSSHPALNSLTHPALTWMSSENFFPNNLATHKYSWTPLDLSLQNTGRGHCFNIYESASRLMCRLSTSSVQQLLWHFYLFQFVFTSHTVGRSSPRWHASGPNAFF